MNKKGFTLIELLAVIIVLAIIMVFAVPAILDTSNAAQQKSFRLYGQRVLEKATEFVETKKMTNTGASTDWDLSTTHGISADEIGLGSNSGYGICVLYSPGTGGDADYTLGLYITNGTYCFNGVSTKAIQNGYSDIQAEDSLLKTKCPAVSSVSVSTNSCTFTMKS